MRLVVLLTVAGGTLLYLILSKVVYVKEETTLDMWKRLLPPRQKEKA